MPLNADGLALIRANLEAIAKGERVGAVTIGFLTEVQLADINASRRSLRFPAPPIIAEVRFLGRHLFKSRIAQDGYTIEEVLEQTEFALSERSVFVPTQRATVLQNRAGRRDRLGNLIQDQAVLECTAYHPWPELFSVIPKGDALRKAKGR